MFTQSEICKTLQKRGKIIDEGGMMQSWGQPVYLL